MPKISALPSVTTPALTDIFPEVQPAVDGTTFKATFNQIFNLFNLNGMPIVPSTVTPNQVLLSTNASNPVWSTATYPSTITANKILYSNFANVIGELSTLPISNGGTGVTSVTTTPTATSFSGWDSNRNLSANNFIDDINITTTSSTVTLNVASARQQIVDDNFIAVNFILPVATTLPLGWSIVINNNSASFSNSIKYNDNTELFAIPGDGSATIMCLDNSTSNGVWNWRFDVPETGLPVINGGTGRTTLTTHGILVGEGTSDVNSVVLTNGQLLIGSTGVDPSAATLSAGAGISISNGAGAVTISASASGAAWYSITATSQELLNDSGFIINAPSLCTLTLPATAFVGMSIYVFGRTGGWTIIENAGQNIAVSPVSTTITTGSLSSASDTDCIHLICTVADSEWAVISQQSSGLIII